MDDMTGGATSVWFFAVVFGVVWLVMSAYLLRVGRRERELGGDLRLLTNALRRHESASQAEFDEQADAPQLAAIQDR